MRLGDRQRRPFDGAALDEEGALLPELGLGALGRTQDMLAQRGGVRAEATGSTSASSPATAAWGASGAQRASRYSRSGAT